MKWLGIANSLFGVRGRNIHCFPYSVCQTDTVVASEVHEVTDNQGKESVGNMDIY